MASQAKQVFYVSDPVDARWSVVLTSQPKDYLIKESGSDDIILEQETFTIDSPPIDVTIDNDDDYIRENGEGLWVEN